MMRSLEQTLFDPALRETQAHEIARVRRSIGGLVRTFCLDTLLGSREFFMTDLEAYVLQHEPHSTPGSAGRILRLLRKEGVVDYVLIRRSDAHYRVLSVKGVV